MSFDFDPAALVPLGESLARAALPTLSTIMSAAAPFPFNLFVGPAFAAISAALGEDPATATPASVKAKIDADPGGATEKLKPVEHEHADAVAAAQAELEARLKDVEDARATGVQLARSGSVLAWGAPAVSVIAVAGFVVVSCLVFLGHGGDSVGGQQILGAMTVGWTTVLTYWLGSSKGSADKTGEIAALAHAALAKTDRASPARNRPAAEPSGR